MFTASKYWRANVSGPGDQRVVELLHRLVTVLRLLREARSIIASSWGVEFERISLMRRTPQHQYQVLTKRPREMVRYFKTRQVPSNFWAGVSVENQRNAWRVDVLRSVRADIRFISAEPLLGPLSLDLRGSTGSSREATTSDETSIVASSSFRGGGGRPPTPGPTGCVSSVTSASRRA